MINYNCSAKVMRLVGNENDKNYKEVEGDFRMLIVPTGTEIAMMYEVPIGEAYSFLSGNQIVEVKPADKFIIQNPMTSGLAQGDEFIVQGIGRKRNALGNSIVDGICIKQ